jgi:hypothetical protein
MDLENQTLENWLITPPPESLKNGGDTFPFHSKYETFKDYLKKNLHEQTTKQAIYQEFLDGKDRDKIIWLNDHGPNHIQTVIIKASELLNNGCKLNAREVFLLLNAIQVHDIGNFYGRLNHEKKVMEAIGVGLTPILFDNIEARYIQTIAQVHGGTLKYKNGAESKNTISSIKPIVMSDDYPIRQQFLASVLRFSDELADNKYRADTKSLDEGRMPKGSEIFHAYASCLDSVKVLHEIQTIELHFKVPKEYLTKTFGKIQKDDTITNEYLIDEIYKRSLKVHAERIYCSKFWKKQIDIDKIWVQIEFYARTEKENLLSESDFNIHNDITFTLHDFEYPNIASDIFTLCPELSYSDGTKMNGINISQKILNNGHPV